MGLQVLFGVFGNSSMGLLLSSNYVAPVVGISANRIAAEGPPFYDSRLYLRIVTVCCVELGY